MAKTASAKAATKTRGPRKRAGKTTGKANAVKGRAHDTGKVTVDTLVKSIAAKRIADHPWFKEKFVAGRVDREGVRRMAEQLVYVFDNVIELYGPMYLNNADYHVRRIFVDKMLAPIKLNDGSKLRLGEGAHAELATDLARALGANVRNGQSATPTARVKESVNAIISSLERPAYWVTLGAMAAVETQMRPFYNQMAKALGQHYGAPEAALRVFQAPLLFSKGDIEHCLKRAENKFDVLRIAYYTERLRDEWYDVWDAVFAAAD